MKKLKINILNKCKNNYFKDENLMNIIKMSNSDLDDDVVRSRKWPGCQDQIKIFFKVYVLYHATIMV